LYVIVLIAIDKSVTDPCLIYIISRTWLRYVMVFAIANPFVCRLSVCLSVRSCSLPGGGRGWSCRQYFLAVL